MAEAMDVVGRETLSPAEKGQEAQFMSVTPDEEQACCAPEDAHARAEDQTSQCKATG